MPIVQQTGQAPVPTGRGMNAYTLRELVKRRVPGYDDSEYLSELNAAYQIAWDELVQMEELWFSDVQTVTVATASDWLDLIANMNAALDTTLPRLHKLHRVRINLPNSDQWFPAHPRSINSTEFLSEQALTGAVESSAPPFYYAPFGLGSLKFAKQLPAGTKVEIFYTFGLLDMQILSVGTIVTNGTAVTGTGTQFSQIVPPEMTDALPDTGSPTEAQVEVELIVNGRVYRVVDIADDTHLTTAVAVNPAIPDPNGATFLLASVPEVPAFNHRVIADLATRNILTTPADDDRFIEWVEISNESVRRMKNTQGRRTNQENAKRGRWPRHR